MDDRGLAYGDGLFETLLFQNAKIPYLKWHRQRLEQGCQRIKLRFDGEQLDAELAALTSQLSVEKAVIKITLSRQQSGRGYTPDVTAKTRRMLSAYTLDNDFSQQQREGVSLQFCETPLAVQPALAGLKHLARLENVLASAELKPPHFEGLMLDTEQRVIEGTRSNVFVIKNQQLLTPDLSRCGVAGVMRQVLLEEVAPQLAIECAVCDLNRSDLLAADELFIANSIMGVVPVKAIAGEQKTQHAITRRLQQSLGHES